MKDPRRFKVCRECDSGDTEPNKGGMCGDCYEMHTTKENEA